MSASEGLYQDFQKGQYQLTRFKILAEQHF